MINTNEMNQFKFASCPQVDLKKKIETLPLGFGIGAGTQCA